MVAAGSQTTKAKAASRALSRARIPLALAHARDRDAREDTVLREGISVGKLLRIRAAAHVHDEETADRACAVVRLSGAREHQDVFLAAQIVAMRLEVLVTDRRGIR